MHMRLPIAVKCPENLAFSSATNCKSEFFSSHRVWEAQSFDPARCLQKALAVMKIAGKLQYVSAAAFGQFRWQHQEFIANRFDRCRTVLRRQAQALEPMDQIVRQEEQL